MLSQLMVLSKKSNLTCNDHLSFFSELFIYFYSFLSEENEIEKIVFQKVNQLDGKEM